MAKAQHSRAQVCDSSLARTNQIVKLTPRWATPYLLRALLRAKANKDLHLAIADCDQSIRLGATKKNIIAAYLLRGKLREARNEVKLAMADYEEVLEISPEDEQAKGRQKAMYFLYPEEFLQLPAK